MKSTSTNLYRLNTSSMERNARCYILCGHSILFHYKSLSLSDKYEYKKECYVRRHVAACFSHMPPVCGLGFIENNVEPHRDKTNKMACAPSEDSDQTGHPPSVISLRCALNG